jgi:molybdopterin converting factor subunit 1
MRIKILFFARLRELAGSGETELEVPEGICVGELPGRVFPEGAVDPGLWRRVRFAVNEDYVPADHELKDGDEAAFIPPVAGG